ncbi:hypothetical protein P8452_55018 [Trifolium repens]|nr:hypothetical protein P8452_55018 [Trifolium repens]
MKLRFRVGLELELEPLKLVKVYQKMLKLENLLCCIGLKQSIRAIDMDIIYISIMTNGLSLRAKNPFSIGEGKEINLEKCPRTKLQ